MSTSPTSLENSITSCLESLKFLKDHQKQLAQANIKADADLRDARTERDNAIKHSRTSQAELDTEKQSVAQYKSSLIQAERTIEEQTGIISRLHREVTHWKEQARNWQEHFTRVEEDRCSLATRLDEMLAEQSQTYGPLISAHLFPKLDASISAPILNQSSTPGSKKKRIINITHPNSVDTTTWSPLPARKAKVTSSRTKINSEQTNKSSGTPSKKEDTVPVGPPSRLLRRVQAVIHVKSEEEDNGELQSDDDALAKDDNYFQTQRRRQGHAGNRKNKQTTQVNDSLNSDVGFDSGEDELLILGSETTRRNIVVHPSTKPPAKKRKLNVYTPQKSTKKD